MAACVGLNAKSIVNGAKVVTQDGMQWHPVCDTGNAADGRCRIVGGDDWHFSHPAEVKKHLPIQGPKMKGAYFYNGNTNGGLSVLHNGQTHVWSKKGVDKNGDTYCVKRTEKFENSFRFKGYEIERVMLASDKAMTSKNILAACKSKEMLPLCNNAKFMDGQCIIVGGLYHISQKEQNANQASMNMKDD